MSVFLLFTFVLFAFGTPCEELKSQSIYTVTDAFECLNSLEIDTTFTSGIQEGLKTLFETYAFKDILKTEDTVTNQFNVHVDIDAKLEELNGEEKSLYAYIQSVQNIVKECQDEQLVFTLDSSDEKKYYFDKMYAILPFIPDIVNGDVILYANNDYETLGYFVPTEIVDNVNIPVKTINDKAPIEFIRDMGLELAKVKSSHGKFTYALETMSLVDLQKTVLSQEFLEQNITIVYTNDVSVTTSYSILYDEELVIEKNSVTGTYDYESVDSILACKTDVSNEMNVLVIKSFTPSDEANFLETLTQCVAVFDENTYPITLILPMNAGGRTDVMATIQEIFAPHGSTDLIGSVRASNASLEGIVHGFGNILSDPETCIERYDSDLNSTTYVGEWFMEPKTVTYGETEHLYTQESLIHSEKLIDLQFTKNPRKPTELIVFTDGYCTSTCGIMTTSLMKQGKAIVVGYAGDPDSTGDFIAGNSISLAITEDLIQTEEVKTFQSLGAHMQLSFVELFNFNYKFEETIPLEFTLNVVNERVSLYKFGDNKLGQFIEEANVILKRYKNQCDDSLPLLVNEDSKCDESMTIEHAHGGYTCSSRGRWSRDCVPSYCDEGYKFDVVNNVCVIDTCLIEPTSESSESFDESSSSEILPVDSESSESFDESSSSEILPVDSESSESFDESSSSEILPVDSESSESFDESSSSEILPVESESSESFDESSSSEIVPPTPESSSESIDESSSSEIIPPASESSSSINESSSSEIVPPASESSESIDDSSVEPEPIDNGLTSGEITIIVICSIGAALIIVLIVVGIAASVIIQKKKKSSYEEIQ